MTVISASPKWTMPSASRNTGMTREMSAGRLAQERVGGTGPSSTGAGCETASGMGRSFPSVRHRRLADESRPIPRKGAANQDGRTEEVVHGTHGTIRKEEKTNAGSQNHGTQ